MTSNRSTVRSAAKRCLEALRDNGVSYVFGSLGSEDAHYWRAFASDAFVPEYVLCNHEQLAVDMARGYARVTGDAQAVKLHGSIGTLNGALSIWGAYYTGTPLVVVSSYVSDYTSGNGPYQLDFRHPTGQSSIVGSFTKWSISADRARQIPKYAQRATRIAATASEGPVFVNMPCSLLDEPVETMHCVLESLLSPSTPSDEVSAQIVERFLTAENSVVIVSDLGVGPDGPDALLSIAETLDIPVFSTRSEPSHSPQL